MLGNTGYALEQALVEPIITSRNVISPNPGRHHAFHGGTGPIVQIYNNWPPKSMTRKVADGLYNST